MILGTFLTITEGNMTTLIGYMSDLFEDLSPLILLIVGVGVAMLVVGFIIRAFTR
jgi:hypothetical protein